MIWGGLLTFCMVRRGGEPPSIRSKLHALRSHLTFPPTQSHVCSHILQGADTVIYERLAHGNAQNAQLKEPTTRHMEEYGSAGLRTLCLAYAQLDPAFYEE